MWIRSRKLSDIRVKELHRKNIKSGINLPDLPLFRTRGLFFDDGLHFGTACTLTHHSAIAGWIFLVGAQQGHRGLLFQMKIAQTPDGLRRDKLSISRQND